MQRVDDKVKHRQPRDVYQSMVQHVICDRLVVSLQTIRLSVSLQPSQLVASLQPSQLVVAEIVKKYPAITATEA